MLVFNLGSIGPFRYRWIHLHAAMIKEDSVSHQTSINLFRYCWIHLQAAIVKEDSVSHQYSIDLFRYRWIHLQAAIVKEDSVSHQYNRPIQISLNSLTGCNSKGGQYQP